MNCSPCGIPIERRDPRTSWRDRTGRKHYGCQECAVSGKFKEWVDQQPPNPEYESRSYKFVSAAIRPDQVDFLEDEEERRTGRRKTRGRYGQVSILIREAIDLLMEYRTHQEFMGRKRKGEQSK